MMNTATTNYQIMLLLLLLLPLLLWVLAIYQHSSKSSSKLSEFQRIYLDITIVWKLWRVFDTAQSTRSSNKNLIEMGFKTGFASELEKFFPTGCL
jgi:hypothetical protein